MVNVPGSSKRCNECRARRLKVRDVPNRQVVYCSIAYAQVNILFSVDSNSLVVHDVLKVAYDAADREQGLRSFGAMRPIFGRNQTGKY